jgi:NADH:ubiquinone oxidoreductase subunit 6 (subunit J)
MKNAKDIFMYSVAVVMIICLFVVIYLLATTPIPQENKEMFYVVIVSLVGFVGIIINYMFGASAKNEKTEIKP